MILLFEHFYPPVILENIVAHCVFSQQSLLPIFTLNILGFKTYIVTSLELVHAIQKQPKNFSFAPVEAKFGSRVLGTSPETFKILMKTANGDKGDLIISTELIGNIRSAILSASNLEKMNRVMTQSIAGSFDSLEVATDKNKLKLANWLRRNLTMATTNSLYGPQNPFKDDLVADAFWYVKTAYLQKFVFLTIVRQFESSLMAQIVNILPSITARKGIAGRTKVAKAFEHYYRIESNKARSMIHDRYEACSRIGLCEEDNALYEVGMSLAFLGNTNPTAFWMLLLVYSYPGLLNDIRNELDSIVTEIAGNELVRYLDTTLLKTNCRLLNSTFQEVLRYRSMAVVVRQVMQDTLLNGQWLLKKNSWIQMPTRVFHADPTLWGTDVDEFNPRRFMNDERQQTRQTRPAASRPFGGGTALCPGRHFATNEVLLVVALFALRYEMRPTSGEWSLPKSYSTGLSSAIMTPDTDVEVEMSTRKGFEDGRWIFELKDSKSTFANVAEGRADPFAGE